MKKIISLPFIISLVLLVSCSGEKTAEQINAEINSTKGKIAELNQQLEELEKQLEAMDTGVTENGTPVVSEALMPGSLSTYITISATVEAANNAMISPETNGRINTVHVREGQKVSRGQLLVSLDSEIMENSIQEIDKGLELAKTMYEKQKGLWEQGVGSELQYLEAKNRYESLQKTRQTLESQKNMSLIYAPFSGYVEEIFMKKGELASPGRQILQLVNLEHLYITTQLSETYITSINEGDTAWVSFPDVPGVTRVAPIINTGQTIDPQSRTFTVRMDMKNDDEKIKPNMLAKLKLMDYSASDVIVVPTQLIRQDLKGSFVYLARPHDGDYFAVKTYIEPGRSDGTMTVVEKGLEAGDFLIKKGYNQIKDGSKLSLSQN